MKSQACIDSRMIADACGVSHATVQKRWVNDPKFPPGSRKGTGGKLTWAVSELPELIERKDRKIKVRRLVEEFLVKQQAMSASCAEPIQAGTPLPCRWSVPMTSWFLILR